MGARNRRPDWLALASAFSLELTSLTAFVGAAQLAPIGLLQPYLSLYYNYS